MPLEGEEVAITPDPLRAGLDPALHLLGVEPAEVVGDLEGAEAVFADVAGVQLVGGPALLALQALYWHPILFSLLTQKPRHLWGEVRSDVPHIFQVSIFDRPAGFGTCLDLAVAMVAGASLGQSLHPSRCGAYVGETIPTDYL